MKVETRDLTPESWPALEKLFGPKSACAGCWCVRGEGIARALLRHALRSIRLAGGRTAEAYPVQPPATNASAFTGTVPFLESEGFVVVTSRPRGRQRARRSLT